MRERLARPEAAQVDEELTVGEVLDPGARPVHRERGLAHRPDAVHGDHARPAGVVGDGDRVQQPQLGLPSGEAGDVGRELPRDQVLLGDALRRHGRLPRRDLHLRGGRGGAGQQPGERRTQLRAGVGAELVGQPRPHLLVGLQRLGGTSSGVQRVQHHHPQGLAQRVVTDHPAHVGDRLRRPACGDVELGAALQRGEIAVDQPWSGAFGQRLPGRLVERLGAPQLDGLLEPRVGIRSLRRVEQVDEGQRVHRGAGQVEDVATGGAAYDLLAEHATQPPDVGVQAAARVVGELLAPDTIGENISGDWRAGVHGQQRQQGAGTSSRDLDGFPCAGDTQWPEKTDAHIRHRSIPAFLS